jgi:GxxExxY protein
MAELIYKSESYEIIGTCMEVHKELGMGFLEPVYQEALAHEFALQSIPYEREIKLSIIYKGYKLHKQYFADFICYNNIILELKAVSSIKGEHEAQVLNYLKASGFRLGLLINFGAKNLSYKRLVL